MIDLTPLEVRKKSGDFRRAMRGYEQQAVDDFLDLVADRLEQLVRENQSLQQRVTSIESQVAEYRERERALTEALVTAQEMREEMRRQMEREVDLKRREAEADADAIRSGAVQMREREEEVIRRLRARQGQFVQSYRGFLERELAELSVITDTLDLGMEEAPTPPPARRRSRRADAAPLAEPIPMPLPVAIPMPEPVAETEPEPEPVPELIVPHVAKAAPPPAQPAEPVRRPMFEEDEAPIFEREPLEPEVDQELLDLTRHFPIKQVEPAPVAEAPKASAQIDFDDAALGEDELPELDLVDEIEEETDDDGDSGGWVSTLLEGKG